MSTRNPTHGTKVTDPNAPQIHEGAGAVASDSLAAESTRAGGGFAENRNSEPLGVSGSNSTFANENISGPRRLDPALDAEARMAEEDWAEEKKLGATASSYPDSTGGQRGSSGSSGEDSSSAGIAPSYVNSQYHDTAGPKGRNLHEGGFESRDANNASFNSEIGSKNDPSRLAEQKFQRQNADYDGDAAFPKQKGELEDNAYETLKRDASA
ncbi:hypothetical protein ONS95_004033 [Cadophora gregata]|uniref:uncharacterized protein n=1 Tax=Cadophora gregata TaxID=51156 RepID=UPI0026DDB8D5|nr:uncharacterized protein ONS95_004033 [Cadophora gregata]KAK0107340.1 hypothetical protein ONS95_004033 [Cadophora gregata]KAK0117019.1 hypothetical protein ONS96_012861 [Cadophora gregata f. sp. sojae]